jgi:hypothetical protein
VQHIQQPGLPYVCTDGPAFEAITSFHQSSADLANLAWADIYADQWKPPLENPNWKEKSRLEYITEGLKDLKRVIAERGIKSVDMPPLGCGNGGLNRSQVRPLIEQSLAEVGKMQDGVAPAPARAAPATITMAGSSEKPSMVGQEGVVATIDSESSIQGRSW